MNTFATLLTNEQVNRTHQASLEILEKVGLLVRDMKAREIFIRHGCVAENERVRFPRKVVEQFRVLIPPSFTFYGRDPKYDRTIPDDSPVIVTGSSAPNMIDPVTGKERRSRSDDIARIAHLINKLPGYDVFSVSVLADDASLDQFTLARLYPALKYCMKPVRITSRDLNDAKKVLELGGLIAGSDEAYRAHPFIFVFSCKTGTPSNSDTHSPFPGYTIRCGFFRAAN